MQKVYFHPHKDEMWITVELAHAVEVSLLHLWRPKGAFNRCDHFQRACSGLEQLFLCRVQGGRRSENTCTHTHLSLKSYSAQLRDLIMTSGTENREIPLRSVQLVFPCVDCAVTECPGEAGAFGPSQILNPLSPSNNTRRGEHHQLRELPKRPLALFDLKRNEKRTRPLVLEHRTEQKITN